MDQVHQWCGAMAVKYKQSSELVHKNLITLIFRVHLPNLPASKGGNSQHQNSCVIVCNTMIGCVFTIIACGHLHHLTWTCTCHRLVSTPHHLTWTCTCHWLVSTPHRDFKINVDTCIAQSRPIINPHVHILTHLIVLYSQDFHMTVFLFRLPPFRDWNDLCSSY
jgi:hypothetical protein